jgi:lipoprotein-releasing system ATP-binding protein
LDLQVAHVVKRFEIGDTVVPVLDDVSFDVAAGDSMAIMGPSGSGKSTVLHIIGTLEPPTSGEVKIGGRNPFALDEPDMARFRNDSIGFVFQDHHLLPQYSVLENTLIPTLAFPGNAAGEARARLLLERVGLTHRLDHRPAQLSGGERQRVAIARALINRPAVLLCDEPTGNLDHRTADAVAELLLELHGQESNVLVVVTHNSELARRFGHRLELREGRCFEV